METESLPTIRPTTAAAARGATRQRVAIPNCLLLLMLASSHAEAFFDDGFEDPSQPLALQLQPAAGVSGAQRVSFALPLPPGTLFETARVSLWQGGLERPLHVASLGSWHALPPAALLCADATADAADSLRSVLLQADIDFGSGQTVLAEVRLDRERTLDLTDPVAVEQTWQIADSGSYTAADGVLEPKALALWPAQHLRCAGLAPALGGAGQRPYLAATDRAQIDFFYTTINDFGPSGWPAT
jgi:hypothetical protein